MKLASLKSGRDGQLVVVSRDLSRAITVPEIAPTLQAALDNWEETSTELEKVSAALNAGDIGDEPEDDSGHEANGGADEERVAVRCRCQPAPDQWEERHRD